MNNYNIYKYFKQKTFMKNTLLISHHFHLPPDITLILYNYTIFHFTYPFVQIIIKAWRKFVAIHKTNLIYLLQKLQVYTGIHNNEEIYYFNLNSIDTLITLKILNKYVIYSTLCFCSWDEIIPIFNNGVYFRFNDYNATILTLNCKSIYSLVSKIDTFLNS